MAFRALRRVPVSYARPAAAAAAAPTSRRLFHATPRAAVQVGDAIPDMDVLVEDSPGNKVNLAQEFVKGNGVVVGVPAAFSGSCSQTHVPSYINHPRLADAGQVFVVSVNDPFV
jgi:peroxiredoxin 5